MQEIDFYLVDAFSDTSFGGNPAAVCPLKEWLPDETLLKMAQQHNQSETAFFVCSKGGIELRWFTTLTEVNLCGHATLFSGSKRWLFINHRWHAWRHGRCHIGCGLIFDHTIGHRSQIST